MSNSAKQLGLLALIVAILAAFVVLFGGWSSQQPGRAGSLPTQTGQGGERIPPPQPSPTTADTVAAQNGQPFQFLVSYVNSGFEPQKTTIHVGDTVRFINNSTGQLWIAASGDPLYPAEQNECGSSALDSCGPLEPGYFWQFIFTQKGTWSFVNNLNKSQVGSIIVTAQ